MLYFYKRLTLIFLAVFALLSCESEAPVPEQQQPVSFKTVNNTSVEKADWPQWRGLKRDGISAESGLARSWPESGPKEVWRKQIGQGYAGVAISNGKVYTSYAEGDDELLFCLDEASGEEIWRYRLNAKFDEQFGNGPRATPTVDGDVVYGLGSYGWLHAINVADGSKIWSLHIHDVFGDVDGEYDRGYSCSPMVEGDLLIVNGGRQPGKTIVALNKKTGEMVWGYENGRNSFSSQVAWDILGERQIVSCIGYGIVGLNPKNGAELWRFRWETSYNLNIAAPLFLPPNYVLISSGYDKGSALIRLDKNDGEWQASSVWKNRLFRNHFNSSVYLDGHIYGFDEKNLKCIDAKTGEDKWANRSYGKGSLVMADGLLIVLGDKGVLAIVEAKPDGYKELGSVQALNGKCWTMPSFANGKVYVRNHNELVSFDLK